MGVCENSNVEEDREEEGYCCAASGLVSHYLIFFLEKKVDCLIGVCRVRPGCYRSGSWATAEHDFFLPRLQLCSFFHKKKSLSSIYPRAHLTSQFYRCVFDPYVYNNITNNTVTRVAWYQHRRSSEVVLFYQIFNNAIKKEKIGGMVLHYLLLEVAKVIDLLSMCYPYSHK
jgi:hypothetical protein